MLHERVGASDPDDASGYKMRLGMYMFVLYALVYAGFVLINIWKPLLMEKSIFRGVNLAVVYGVGLIVFALVLALIYNSRCTRKEDELRAASQDNGGE